MLVSLFLHVYKPLTGNLLKNLNFFFNVCIVQAVKCVLSIDQESDRWIDICIYISSTSVYLYVN